MITSRKKKETNSLLLENKIKKLTNRKQKSLVSSFSKLLGLDSLYIPATKEKKERISLKNNYLNLNLRLNSNLKKEHFQMNEILNKRNEFFFNTIDRTIKTPDDPEPFDETSFIINKANVKSFFNKILITSFRNIYKTKQNKLNLLYNLLDWKNGIEAHKNIVKNIRQINLDVYLALTSYS